MQRMPAVAGRFYPGQAGELRRSVTEFLGGDHSTQSAIGLMVPHAGYLYSGAIAGQVFSRIDIPSTVVLLGPNHTGRGAPLAVFPPGSWLTPLGDVLVDEQIAGQIVRQCPGAMNDELAHRDEHSLEVLLPFIQVRASNSSIVPICVGHSGLSDLLAFGRALGQLLTNRLPEVLLVASSDMTHFETAEKARQQDLKALEKILALDPEGLFRVVVANRISMCGVLPMVVMLAAALELKAARATLVRYGNSGEVSGDLEDVVGYAGVIVE